MTSRRGIAAALLLSLVATACGSARASGVFRASDVDGGVEVRTGPGGDWEPLINGRSVDVLDEVRTGPGASVKLGSDRTRLELGADTWIVVGSLAVATAKTGSVLVETEQPVRVSDGGGVIVIGPGTFRLDYGRRVGAYRG
ncbi:MAG TPA: hypothetical protein VM841_05405, partial [Actinomycetota bacterium]|nr:hypothetical protein [Actinomycetota bacterium]